MKKLGLIVLVLFFTLLSVEAGGCQKIKYKNIKDGAKIIVNESTWSFKVPKKSDNYYVKKVSEGFTKFSEFYSSDGIFLFSAATQYEFINNGRLIGYSNLNLKFYEFYLENGLFCQRELALDEIQELFPKYEIIQLSQFSTATNSLKIKKKNKVLKLIVLNDTDMNFDNYAFTTNNSKIKYYKLKGFLNITKRGMIQFSRFGENSKYAPWYVILVR